MVSQEKRPTKEDAAQYLGRVSKYDKTDAYALVSLIYM